MVQRGPLVQKYLQIMMAGRRGRKGLWRVCVLPLCLGRGYSGLPEMDYGLLKTFLSILVQLPPVFTNHLDCKPYCKCGVIPRFADGYL